MSFDAGSQDWDGKKKSDIANIEISRHTTRRADPNTEPGPERNASEEVGVAGGPAGPTEDRPLTKVPPTANITIMPPTPEDDPIRRRA